MAKSKKTLEENQAQLKANRAELKQIYAAENQINDALLERGILLEKENVQLEKNIASQKRNKKAIDASSKSISSNNKFLEDTEDILGSIADKVGKNNKLYKEGEKYLKTQKSGLESIAVLTQNIADPKLSKAAEKAVDAYKKYQESVARVADRTAMTGKQQEEANVAIARARAELDATTASLAQQGEAGQMVLDTINGMANDTERFAKTVTAATKEWSAMDAVLGSFSGIPVMSEFNTLLKTNIRDTLAWKAAIFALGAALGKAAMDYFGAPIKAGLQADKERQQNQIDGVAAVAKLQTDAQYIPKQIEQERLEARINAEGEIAKLQQEAAFAGAKAAIQFSAQMQQGAAQFERAAKTALFGNKIGSVGYGAAQLQLAGISADKIASGMEAASAATGKMPSAKVGADMAIMAERTGASVDNIASINEMFQRMDGVTESTAMNLSEGLRAMADQAKIGLGGLMREIAEASKDALSYQIKSGPALAKQVAYAQSLGVNFGDIAKAGKSMVMNYKDSIKQEMQLSAMLGKNVDLSEVRAKFASGDTSGALEALKAQGLDPAQMDMFAQDALSQALGGMDLNSLQKIATKSGAQVGGLTEGNAGAGNKDFLSRTQAAESQMAMKQASISAQTAILDAQLSQKIADSYLASGDYKLLKENQNKAAQEAEKLSTAMTDTWKASDAYQKQLSDTAQLDFTNTLKTGLLDGLAAVGGGLLTTAIDKLIPKGGGGGGTIAAAAGGGMTAAGTDSVSAAVAGTTEAAANEATAQSGGFFTRIGAKMDGAIASIVGLFTRIKEGILGTWERVTGWFTGIGTKISELWGTVTGFFTGIGSRIKEGFLGFVDIVKGKIVDGWNKITGYFSGLIDSIKNFFKSKFSKKGAISAVSSVSSVAGGGGGEEGGEEGGGIPPGVAGQAKAFSNIDFKGAGKGIGSFLQNVGKGAGTLIQNIMTGIANGLMQFANPMVVAGAIGFGAAIVAIGAGLAGAAWIMGKALPTLAEGMMAFNKVDGGNLTKVGLGIAAMGVGMAAMGAGAVLSGIGNLVGSLFGGGIEDTIKKMETFSKANIDVQRVKNNADAAVAYAKAMAAVGGGSALSGLGNLVGSIADGIAGFFGKKPPLEQMEEFGNLDIKNKDKIKENAETFAIFGNAMSSYKGGSGSLGGVLGDALAGFFKVKPPIEAMKDFAKEDFGQYKDRIKANAEAFTLFGNAMATYKGSSGGLGEVLAQGVASFLKIPTPLDKFKEFAAMEGIDVERTKKNAEAFTAFGNAMASYQGEGGTGFWSSLGEGISSFFGGGKEDLITKFQRFAALDAGGVTAISTAIGSFNANLSGFNSESAEAVGKGMASVANATSTYLTSDRTDSINAFASAIGTLNSQLTALAGIASLVDTTAFAFSNLASALNTLGSINTGALKQIPWGDMEDFASEGGKFVLASSGGGSFALSKETSDNIKKMATNTEAMVKLNNTMAKLLKEGFFGGETSNMKLYIDGKDVNHSMKRYKDNTKKTGPEETSDIRLKQNIQLIGVSKLGINIYTFEYIEQVGLEGTYQGVMAQELIGTEFESALIFDGEYYAVDYSKLDVEFIKLS